MALYALKGALQEHSLLWAFLKVALVFICPVKFIVLINSQGTCSEKPPPPPGWCDRFICLKYETIAECVWKALMKSSCYHNENNHIYI